DAINLLVQQITGGFLTWFDVKINVPWPGEHRCKTPKEEWNGRDTARVRLVQNTCATFHIAEMWCIRFVDHVPTGLNNDTIQTPMVEWFCDYLEWSPDEYCEYHLNQNQFEDFLGHCCTDWNVFLRADYSIGWNER